MDLGRSPDMCGNRLKEHTATEQEHPWWMFTR